MSGKIGLALESARESGRVALIPFLVAGDPDVDSSIRLVIDLARDCADVIELGVAYSDPLADGPVNRRAAERALRNGTTLPRVLEMVAEIRKTCEIPIVLFSYVNPLLRMGWNAFAASAARSGVDGLLVVDLPPEEAGDERRVLRAAGLDTPFLAAPTSTDERLDTIASASSGFIYCVSRAGVTGVRDDLPEELTGLLARVRDRTRLPVAVGFGISKPEHVASLKGRADAAVVGSALVALAERERGGADLIGKVRRMAEELARAGR